MSNKARKVTRAKERYNRQRIDYLTSYYKPSGVDVTPAMIDQMEDLVMSMANSYKKPDRVLVTYVRETVAMVTIPAMRVVITDENNDGFKELRRTTNVCANAIERAMYQHEKMATASLMYIDEAGNECVSSSIGQKMITGCLVSFISNGGPRIGYSDWRPEIDHRGMLLNPNSKPVARNVAILRALATEINITTDGAFVGSIRVPNKITDKLPKFIERTKAYFKDETGFVGPMNVKFDHKSGV